MKKIPYKTDQDNPTILAYKEAVEKGKKDQHVLPRENGWIVKSLLSEKMSQSFNTQQEAAKYAESIAKNLGTAVFVHDSDGRIVDRKDYQ
ncbi:DUF2188 domain-containing protein [Candidatus Daviesbacteria bacterium]|nr:DUF2188 domain-containing protein [Candidatus Daviesbacteria bacterium]